MSKSLEIDSCWWVDDIRPLTWRGAQTSAFSGGDTILDMYLLSLPIEFARLSICGLNQCLICHMAFHMILFLIEELILQWQSMVILSCLWDPLAFCAAAHRSICFIEWHQAQHGQACLQEERICVKSCLTKCIAPFEPIASFDPIGPANPQGVFSSSWNALVQEPGGHKEWWRLALFVPITIFLIDSCEYLLSMSAALSCCFTDTFSSEELVLRDTTMFGCSYALPMSLNQGVKDSCVLSRAASLLVGSLF